MFEQNLIQLAKGFAKTTGQSVSSIPSIIVENEIGSFQILKIVSLRITNLDSQTSYPITAIVIDNNNPINEIANNIEMPPGTTLILLTKDSELWLQEGQALLLSTTENLKLDAVCSYELASREEILTFTNENFVGNTPTRTNVVLPVLQNSTIYFDFILPNAFISNNDQTLYWRIKNITNSNNSDFVNYNGEIFIPSLQYNNEFTVTTNFIGNLQQTPSFWSIEICLDSAYEQPLYETAVFSTQIPTATSSFDRYQAYENNIFNLNATISNVGTNLPVTLTIVPFGQTDSTDFVGGYPATLVLNSASTKSISGSALFQIVEDHITDNNEIFYTELQYNGNVISSTVNNPISIIAEFQGSSLSFTNENISGAQNAQSQTAFSILENSEINCTFTTIHPSVVGPATLYWQIHHVSNSIDSHFVSPSGSFTIETGSTTGTFSIVTAFIGVNNRPTSQWYIHIFNGSLEGELIYESSTFATESSNINSSYEFLFVNNIPCMSFSYQLTHCGTKNTIFLNVVNQGLSTNNNFLSPIPSSVSLSVANPSTITYLIDSESITSDDLTINPSLVNNGTTIYQLDPTLAPKIPGQFLNATTTFTTPSVSGGSPVDAKIPNGINIPENSLISFQLSLQSAATSQQTVYWKIIHVENSSNSNFSAASGNFVVNVGDITKTFSLSTAFIEIVSGSRPTGQWKIQLLVGSLSGNVVYETGTFSTIPSTITGEWIVGDTWRGTGAPLQYKVSISGCGINSQTIPVALEYGGTAQNSQFSQSRTTSAIVGLNNLGTGSANISYSLNNSDTASLPLTMYISLYIDGKKVFDGSNTIGNIITAPYITGTSLQFYTVDGPNYNSPTNAINLFSVFNVYENSDINFIFTPEKPVNQSVTYYWRAIPLDNMFVYDFAETWGSFVVGANQTYGTFTVTPLLVISPKSNRQQGTWKVYILTESYTGSLVLQSTNFRNYLGTYQATWSNSGLLPDTGSTNAVDVYEGDTAYLNIKIANAGTHGKTENNNYGFTNLQLLLRGGGAEPNYTDFVSWNGINGTTETQTQITINGQTSSIIPANYTVKSNIDGIITSIPFVLKSNDSIESIETLYNDTVQSKYVRIRSEASAKGRYLTTADNEQQFNTTTNSLNIKDILGEITTLITYKNSQLGNGSSYVSLPSSFNVYENSLLNVKLNINPFPAKNGVPIFVESDFDWYIQHGANSSDSLFVAVSGKPTLNGSDLTFDVQTNLLAQNITQSRFWQIVIAAKDKSIILASSPIITTPPVSVSSSWSSNNFLQNTAYTNPIVENSSFNLDIRINNIGTATNSFPVTISNIGTTNSEDFTTFPTSATAIVGISSGNLYNSFASVSVQYIPIQDNITEGSETLSASVQFLNLISTSTNNPVTVIDRMPQDPNYWYVTSGNGTLELGNGSTVGTTLPSNWFVLKDSASDIERKFYGQLNQYPRYGDIAPGYYGIGGLLYADVNSKIWAPVDIHSPTLSQEAMNILGNTNGLGLTSNVNPYYQTDHVTDNYMLNIANPAYLEPDSNLSPYGNISPFYSPAYLRLPPVGEPPDPTTSVGRYQAGPFLFYKGLSAVSFYTALYDITHTVWHIRMPKFGKNNLYAMSSYPAPFASTADFTTYGVPGNITTAYPIYNYRLEEKHKRPNDYNSNGFQIWGVDMFISSMGWISVQNLAAGQLLREYQPDGPFNSAQYSQYCARMPTFINSTNPLDFLQTSGQAIRNPSNMPTTKYSWLGGADGFAIGVAARVERNDGNLRRLLVSVDPAAVAANDWNSSSYIRIRYEYTNPTTIYEITFYDDRWANPSPKVDKTQEGWYTYKMVLVTGEFNRSTNIINNLNGLPDATNSQLVTRSWTSYDRLTFPNMEDSNIWSSTKYDIPMASGDQGFTYNNVSNNCAQFIPESNKSYVIGVGKDTNRVFYGKIWGPDQSSPNGYYLRKGIA